MRRFQFRLQSILDVRRYQEDQKRMELGSITSRCATLQDRIDDRRRRRREVLTQEDPEARAEDVRFRSVQAAYAARLNGEILRLQTERDQAEQERLAAVDRYREARRAADVLSRLRERRAAQYRYEQGREEQKRIDEIAMTRRMHHGNTIQ